MRGVCVLLCVASSACLELGGSACGEGVCPPNLTCVVDELRANACDTESVHGALDGTCHLCVLATCGNGVLDPGEICDDGNTTSADGCPATCSAPCGDGLVDPGETCDDGNTVAGDGCSARCIAEVCGSGALDTGEACDDGNLADNDGCSNHCVAEQVVWSTLATAPPARSAAAMAYDAARGVVVLFGGCVGDPTNCSGLFADTWEWDGVTWTNRTTANTPSPRFAHAMAYDAARRKVVLHGGCLGVTIQKCMSPLSDTWEWDGTSWAEVGSAVPVFLHAMTYDAARREIVLFGGCELGPDQDCAPGNTTWTWDGVRWTEHVGLGPPRRFRHAMTYDPARGVTVMFGGAGPQAGMPSLENLADTWEWDGATWQLRATAGPPPRHAHAMAYDGGTTLLAAGCASAGDQPCTDALGDLWQWNGTTWTERTVPVPPARGATAMAYDGARHRVVMFGGVDDAVASRDTWEWNGATWTERDVIEPPARSGPAIAYASARGVVTLFGGFRDIWEWDGEQWRETFPATSPPERDATMAYDRARDRIVLFSVGETWEWDGNDWQLRATTGPGARRGVTMAYDAARGVTVLFGGGGVDFDDTWLWDGTAWTSVRPMLSPPASGGPMAYDAARGVVVMFDGVTTWEWDGAVWLVGAPLDGPPARGPMTYDATRRTTILLAGTQVWEWDGVAWAPLATTTPPGALAGVGVAYDEARRTLVYAGPATSLLRTTAPGGDNVCVTGFANGVEVFGCDHPTCAARCSGCGDGTCGVLEDCRLCPEDCGACRSCGDLHCDPGESCPGDCP